MGLLLVFHPLLRKAWNTFYTPDRRNGPHKSGRFQQRVSFDYAFALLFLVILHGVSAAKVLLILYTNYHIAMNLPRKYMPAVTWFYNIAVLFANELCEGYRFRDLASWITPPVGSSAGSPESALVSWGAWLDGFGGLVPRWEVLFNITILRLISFNLDYYWSVDRRQANALEVSLHPYQTWDDAKILIRPRRSSWTLQASQNEIASLSPRGSRNSLSATMSLTLSTPLFTLLDLFSLSTTTSLSKNTVP